MQEELGCRSFALAPAVWDLDPCASPRPRCRNQKPWVRRGLFFRVLGGSRLFQTMADMYPPSLIRASQVWEVFEVDPLPNLTKPALVGWWLSKGYRGLHGQQGGNVTLVAEVAKADGIGRP